MVTGSVAPYGSGAVVAGAEAPYGSDAADWLYVYDAVGGDHGRACAPPPLE